jgi:hypothetical protein
MSLGGVKTAELVNRLSDFEQSEELSDHERRIEKTELNQIFQSL